ncbi:MAG: DUF4785 domain-containing protein, partial [Marinicella sp.]
MKNTRINKTIMTFSLLAVSQLSMAEAEISWIESPEVKTLKSLAQSETIDKNQWQSDAVQYNINLIGDEIKTNENKGFIAESKSFYMDFNGYKLNAGVDIPVWSKSAVIRLSALQTNIELKSSQLELTQGSKTISTEIMATGEQLNKLGMPVAENTLAMKVNHEPGLLHLKLNNSQSDAQFVLHVLEPESPYRLAMTTAKQLYQAGDTLTVKAELLAEQGHLPMQMKGYISQPNGEKYADLEFKADGTGQMIANLSQLPFQSMNNGLWEVHTIAKSEVDGQLVMRDLSSAFAVAVPTAQFNGQLKFSGTEIELGVNNEMASRYEANGVLMGHDKAGNQHPIAMLMT